jgi:intraflagellar transport protein 52
LKSAKVFILAGPREKFNENEINCLKKYIDGGGSLLVMLGDGGENQFQTNINFLLEEYGIMINNGMEIFCANYSSSNCFAILQIL